MESVGMPGMLLPTAIAIELLGGLALLADFKTSFAAIGLAAFSVVAAVFFHMDFADPSRRSTS